MGAEVEAEDGRESEVEGVPLTADGEGEGNADNDWYANGEGKGNADDDWYADGEGEGNADDWYVEVEGNHNMEGVG